jgi:paraquat-inducible protein A
MTTVPSSPQLRSCPCCALVQHIPARIPHAMRACCARCGTTLRETGGVERGARANAVAAAFALAAIILFPLAVSLPMIHIERFGHENQSSVLQGIHGLLTRGHVLIGLVVLFCSLVFPLGKLASLLVLCLASPALAHRHRALMFRLVEFTGRWGMLDVLLVAILVAVLKLGDLVEVSPGPAAAAFTSCVVLSLVATACFRPHALFGGDRAPLDDQTANPTTVSPEP